MKYQHVLTLTMCYIENLLYGNQIFGWPCLMYVLKNDGIFSQECSGDSTLVEVRIVNSKIYNFIEKLEHTDFST